ncbi:MAG: amidohydrolase [Schwartzia succinivorans]|nr:amidohydrolase [Schwartzia succinivorans]
MKTLIKNASVLLPDGKVKETDIAVDGAKIAKVGDAKDFAADTVIDGKGKFAVPGFVNAHTHASMTLLRSYADDMNLMDWLQNKIWPIEAKMKKDDIYWGAMLAAVEMIRTGTTTFADMYGDMEKVAEVAIDSGLRAVLSRGIIGSAPNGEAALEENIKLFDDYHGAGDGCITVMFGPHAPYTCPPDFLRRVAKIAKERKAEVHIHLAETKGEVENCLKDYGKTPIALMEETGILDCGVLGAHCVHLSDDDIVLMKKYNTRAAHNPGSNMKLASGIAPVPKLLKAGVCVGLGTDGTSSNNNLDMLEEIRLAALLHKVDTLDPLAVPALEAVRMGTEYGAKAVGLKNLGKIEAGCQADVVLFDMGGAAWTPKFDLVSLLVYAASSADVDTVMVAGRLLMEKKRLLTLDEERVLFEANRCAERISAK